MGESLITVLNLINTGGVIAVLLINVLLLLRGDILPRRVYEKLTEVVAKEFGAQIITTIRTIIREELDRQ